MFWRVEVFESGQYALLTDVEINGKAILKQKELSCEAVVSMTAE